MANNGLGKEVTPQAVRLLDRHQIGTNTPPSQNKNISNLKGCFGTRVSNVFLINTKGGCSGPASVTIFVTKGGVLGPYFSHVFCFQGKLFGIRVSNDFCFGTRKKYRYRYHLKFWVPSHKGHQKLKTRVLFNIWANYLSFCIGIQGTTM